MSITEYTAGTRLACHSQAKGATMATVARTGSATRSACELRALAPRWVG